MDNFGVFEVLAADENDHRLAARKALNLSEGRVNQRLGKWFSDSQNATDFDARFTYVEDQFNSIIKAASEETGHENPEAIAKALRDHYRPAEYHRAYTIHEARRPKMCPYHNEIVDISLASADPQAGYNAMSSHAWGKNHCQGNDYEGPRCKFKKEMVTQSYWDNHQETLNEKRDQIEQPIEQFTEPEAEITETPIDTVEETEAPEFVGEDGPLEVSEAPAVSEFTMEMAANVKETTSYVDGGHFLADGSAARTATENPSDQDDTSNKSVSCPECGGDGKTNGGKTCPRCKGHGKVNDWGSSTLDALNSKTANQFIKKRGDKWVVTKHSDGSVISTHASKEQAEASFKAMMMHKGADENNTDLDGPEPKIDKRLWTPENVKKYKEKSERWPSVEKDIIEPIKAVNDDPLVEIGEKTTETQKLPTGEGLDGGGFAKGGEESGPHTKTFPDKKQTDPVTQKSELETVSKVAWHDPYDEYDEDNFLDFANPGSALRAERHDNPRNLPCPNCGTPNVLTPEDVAHGYQCDHCADMAEGLYPQAKTADGGGASYPPEAQIPEQGAPAQPYNPQVNEELVGGLHPAAQYAYKVAVQRGAHPEQALQEAQAKQGELVQRATQGQGIEGVQIPVVGMPSTAHVGGFVAPKDAARAIASRRR